jgi:hypothetical protein
MTTMHSMTAEWVTRLADDERRRDEVKLRAKRTVDRRTDLVSQHGRRMLDELRTTVVRDVEAFRREFPGDPVRAFLIEEHVDGGFSVRRLEPPTASMAIVPTAAVGSLSCEYFFSSADGKPPRRDLLDFVFTNTSDDTLQLKLQGTAQVFANPDTLSEYLLMPVLTGRPR